jgi:pyridoxal phosphate enzyme (YggS family)
MTARQIIADNLRRVRDRIAAAAQRAGRDSGEISLVAVTKYVDASTAARLFECGGTDLGESRPQQLWAKAADPQLAGARWHLVGRLQANKIRRTLPLTTLIHSVDDAKLLGEIDRSAAALQLKPRVLLEVNCSGETAKQGFTGEDLRRAFSSLAVLQHVEIAGLMTMAPLEGGESAARRAFAALRELRDVLRQGHPATPLAELSMGMSGDFEVAIAEGATLVRVGTALYEGLSS